MGGATGTLERHYSTLKVFVHERGPPHLVDPSRLLRSATRLWAIGCALHTGSRVTSRQLPRSFRRHRVGGRRRGHSHHRSAAVCGIRRSRAAAAPERAEIPAASCRCNLRAVVVGTGAVLEKAGRALGRVRPSAQWRGPCRTRDHLVRDNGDSWRRGARRFDQQPEGVAMRRARGRAIRTDAINSGENLAIAQ
jgi:hypothetical protein